MSKGVSIAVSVVLLSIAGIISYSQLRPVKSEPVDADLLERSRLGAERSVTATGQPGGGAPKVQLSGAKEVVTRFVLAVVNPDKTQSLATGKSGLVYLTDELKAEVNGKFQGDAAMLLSLSVPARFEVSDPVAHGDGAQTSVRFDVPGGPQTRLFGLVRQGDSWLISGIIDAVAPPRQ